MGTRRAITAATFVALLLCAAATQLARAAGLAGVPMAAIVIDDLGNLREGALRSIELPGAVTYAVLPHTHHGPELARLAHALHREVLVHLPMEATSSRALGPGGLTAALAHHQFTRRALEAFDSVPHARGVSNHMGSRLTAMDRPMGWLMELISLRGDWLFLDSRTTARTVAETTARAMGVRTTFRDVFLDNKVSDAAIRRRFAELVAHARAEGSAVAIGHPYPQTLRVLEEELPGLSAHGVQLVPLSVVIEHRSQYRVRVAQSSRGQAINTR